MPPPPSASRACSTASTSPSGRRSTHGDGPLLVLAGRRLGQDPRADAPHRLARARGPRAARRDPRDHVHEQGRAGDARARRAAARPRDPRDVGDDLPRRLRAASCAPRRRGSATRASSRSTTRPTRDGWSSAASTSSTSTPKRFTPAAVHNQISDAKNQLRDAEAYRQLVGAYFEQTVADVYELYERELQRMNAMDFDDLLVRTVNVLELFPEVRDRYAGAFRHVLVDEYQDTNHAQYRLLQLLAGEHRNLMVVGDDEQSIYGFRGADIRNILDFEDDFPDATVVKLEQNYRSTQTILSAANAVIANNRGQKRKTLWTDVGEGDPIRIRELDDEHAEARFVVGRDRAARRRGRRPRTRSRSSTGPTRSRGCSRTRSCAREIPYQVDRRHEVLRARRDQGRDRLPAPCSSTRRTPSRSPRIANSPRRGIGADLAVARAARTPTTMGITRLGRRRDAGAGARARHRRESRRSGASWRRWQALRERVRAAGPGRRPARGACCTRPATSTRWRPSARSRRRAASRTSRSSSRSAREFDARAGAAEDARSTSSCSRSRSSPTPTRAATTRAS